MWFLLTVVFNYIKVKSHVIYGYAVINLYYCYYYYYYYYVNYYYVYYFFLKLLSGSIFVITSPVITCFIVTLFVITFLLNVTCVFLGDFSGSDQKPAVLWSLYFNQLAPEVTTCTTGVPNNIMVTSLPGADLGFGQAMEEVIFANFSSFQT